MEEKAGPVPPQNPVALCLVLIPAMPNEQKICQGDDAILCD